jgi:hypothetical protein
VGDLLPAPRLRCQRRDRGDQAVDAVADTRELQAVLPKLPGLGARYITTLVRLEDVHAPGAVPVRLLEP